MSATVLGLIAVSLVYGFYNGLRNSSNIVATMISTRALHPRRALTMAAVMIAISPFVFGVAVATTIGRDIVADEATTLPVVYAALISAITWNIVTLLLGIPSSSSHALIGGMVGGVWAGYGLDAILWSGLLKVLLALILSPILGGVAGYFVIKGVYASARNSSPQVNVWFQRGQVLSGMMLALAHGANDAQKTMGIMTFGLVATGTLMTFEVPIWVVGLSAGAMAVGTYLGGWRLIRTLGMKFYRVRPIHGFSALSASSVVILVAALLGGPASTTHVVSSAIIGAGTAERINMVRWGVISNILLSWILTIPMVSILSALIYRVVVLF